VLEDSAFKPSSRMAFCFRNPSSNRPV